MSASVSHGQRRCYKNGCQEPECRLANSAGGRVTEHGIIGGHLMSPIEPTAREISQLRQRITLKRIARLAGLPYETVKNVARQRSQKVQPKTAEAIHGVWMDYYGPVRAIGKAS